MNVDHAVLLWVAGHRTGWATALARGLMAVGLEPRVRLIGAMVFVSAVAVLRCWRTAIATVLSALAALAVTEGVKLVVQRPRPPAQLALVEAGGYAMPSTDAAITAAAATVLVVAGFSSGRWVWRVLAGVVLGLTVVVGWALVYLGAHWPTDVLAGWPLGAALGTVTRRLLGPHGRTSAGAG